MTHAINVGILLDSEEIPAWQSRLIQELSNMSSVAIKVAALGEKHGVAEPRHGFGRAFSLWERLQPRFLLYDAFRRRERARHSTAPDACKNCNAKEALRDIPWLRIPDVDARGAPRPRAAALAEIAAHELDVVVALGACEAIDALCPVAKHGVWFFRHDFGQTARPDGSAVGFWEVLRRRPYIRSALLIRRFGVDADAVGYESYSGIHHLSYTRSRNRHLWKALFFIPRTLQQLHERGPADFFRALPQEARGEPLRRSARKWRLTSARLLWPVALYRWSRAWIQIRNKLYRDKWILLLGRGVNTEWLTARDSARSTAREHLARFAKVLPPEGRFWADPYVLRRNDGHYVFFEDASVASGLGRLSVIRVESDGRCSPPSVVLERPYHLSYPFLFEWRDELFLVPESAENRTVELYRCRRFPDDWELAHNLMENVDAYDATLVEHEGRWWMFACVKAHPGAGPSDELCLFHAESPVSRRWHPHPLNPVISDVRYARPAGRLFRANGELYRPSQNSSYRYGYALNLNRIVELTPTAFREEVVRTIVPDWDRSILTVHTLNSAGELVALDAVHRARRRNHRP